MQKSDLINALVEIHGYQSYLEIGSEFTGNKFADIDRTRISRVERLMYRTPATFDDGLPIHYRTASEDASALYASLQATGSIYDAILVDPYHSYNCSWRDIDVAVSLLSRHGTIVVHDCDPPSQDLAARRDSGGAWCGLTFAAFIDFVHSRSTVAYCTVDADYGCGILRHSPTRLVAEHMDRRSLRHPPFGWRAARIRDSWQWHYFSRHRRQLLRLIDPENFLRIETALAHASLHSH